MRTSVSFVFESPDDAAEFLERVRGLGSSPSTVECDVAPPSDPPLLAVVPPPPVPLAAVPPPPPPSAVPPAPPSPSPVPPVVERDAAGSTWDGEIHASSKSKTKDGMWRRKRGVSAQDAASTVAGRGLAAVPGGGLTVPPANTPPPPPAGAGTPWDAVVRAFGLRIAGYTQEQIQAALREGGVEPTALFDHPEQYAQAIAILDLRCPVGAA